MSNKTLIVGLTVWNLVVTGLLLVACQAAAPTPIPTAAMPGEGCELHATRILTEEIVIIQEGHIFAKLGRAMCNPEPGLQMYDSKGRVSLQLSVHAGSPELAFYNPDDTVSMTLDGDGCALWGPRPR